MTPRVIELTERGNPKYISDIMTLTVNVKSTVLSFSFVSDDETSLVGPMGGNVTSIVEDGTNQDVTRALFPTFAAGAEPVDVTIRSDCDSGRFTSSLTCTRPMPEPPTLVPLSVGVISLLACGMLRRKVKALGL